MHENATSRNVDISPCLLHQPDECDPHHLRAV